MFFRALPSLVVLALFTSPVAAAQVTVALGPDGDGAGTPASALSDLAIDSSGVLYATGTQGLFARDPNGSVSVLVGSSGDGSGAPSDVYIPSVVEVEASGDLIVGGTWLSPFGLARVAVFRRDSGGGLTEIFGSLGDGQGNLLIFPTALVTDAAGNVFLGAFDQSNVFRIAPDGTVDLVPGPAGDGTLAFFGADDLVVDSQGRLYVASQVSNAVFRIEPAGAVSVLLDSSTSVGGTPFGAPTSLAIDASDRLVVGMSGRVLERTAAGAVTLLADATGDGVGAGLARDTDVTLTADGGVLLTARGQGATDPAVFFVAPGGGVRSVLDGSGGAGVALANPKSPWVDGNGDLYLIAEPRVVLRVARAESLPVTGAGVNLDLLDAPPARLATPWSATATLQDPATPASGVAVLLFSPTGLSTGPQLDLGLGLTELLLGTGGLTQPCGVQPYASSPVSLCGGTLIPYDLSLLGQTWATQVALGAPGGWRLTQARRGVVGSF